MRGKIEFKKIPKGKEKDRLYCFPVSKNTKIDTNTLFTKEIHKLVNSKINEIDLEKLKRKDKNISNDKKYKSERTIRY